MNTWKRKALAVVAVALLGIPAALGVYKALLPTRGPWGAGLAAGGFELVYISTAILVLTPELRAYARRVALAAVGTSILLNSIADYQARVPGGLAGWSQAHALFDPLALILSIVESAPLAGLAYAMAELLHRLSDGERPAGAPADEGGRDRAHRARTPQTAPQPLVAVAAHVSTTPENTGADRGDLWNDAAWVDQLLDEAGVPPAPVAPARDYTCKHCGGGGLTSAELMAHGRRVKRYGSCQGAQVSAAD